MIEIKANHKDEGMELAIEIEGEGGAIVEEAFRIMQQLPKQIAATNQALYFRFIAKLIESGDFGVAPRPEQTVEADSND